MSKLFLIGLGSVVVVGAIVWLLMSMRKKQKAQKTLYERLGGIYAIAAVVDKFSDNLLKNPVVGVGSKNPALADWSQNKAQTRLPGLKFMRTLWMADVTGGPFKFHRSSKLSKCPFGSKECFGGHLSLHKHHCPFKITPNEFDEVANELNNTLLSFNVPDQERKEVLAAFASHKPEITNCV